MTFAYKYESAKTERIRNYCVSNMANYVGVEVPAMLSSNSNRRRSRSMKAPRWFVDRVLDAHYRAAPHLKGLLPNAWCRTIDYMNLRDPMTDLRVEMPTLYVPNGVYVEGHNIFTEEDLKRLGLFDAQAMEYKNMKDIMQPLLQFIRGLERCVPIVAIQRHPWILERFTKNMLHRMLDNYTLAILSDYRKEFDALPQRKDVKVTPPADLLPALEILSLIRLQEH